MRSYVTGCGKGWDPDGWPLGDDPTVRARFDAFLRWANRVLLHCISDEEKNALWCLKDDISESYHNFLRFLKQSANANTSIFPTPHYMAISRMHHLLPAEGSAEIRHMLELILVKRSNILRYCRVKEWILRGDEAQKKNKEKGVSLIGLHVHEANCKKRVSPPSRTSAACCIATIDDASFPPNFVLPPGQQYQPVDGPLALRGVFLPLYPCNFRQFFLLLYISQSPVN